MLIIISSDDRNLTIQEENWKAELKKSPQKLQKNRDEE
jgi:hypothetical protein